MTVPRFVINTATDSIGRLFGLLDSKNVDCLIISSEPLPNRTRHSVVVTSDTTLTESVRSSFKNARVINFMTEMSDFNFAIAVYTFEGKALSSKTYAKEAVLQDREALIVRLQTSHASDLTFDTQVEVAIDSQIDTAVSVKYKVEMTGISLLRKFFDRFDESPTAETQRVADFDFTASEIISERTLRGFFNPPQSVAVVAVEPHGKAALVEDLWSLEKLRSEVASKATKQTGLPVAQKDSGFYTNIGGSIVKAGSDIQSVVSTSSGRLRMNEPLPGVNVSRYVSEVLNSGWLGVEGPFVRLLERRFSALCGGQGAVAVHSGTAALWGALKALGVGEGDGGQVVLCPAFTCAACADAVVQAGGHAVVVDCESISFGMSAQAVRCAMDVAEYQGAKAARVFGVVVAPCYGVPAKDLLEIRDLCHSRGAFLIEDNCESYGASISDQSNGRLRLGEVGDISVVSIRSEKMVGVGEGGVIISRSAALVEKARWWCSRAPTRGVGLWRVYEHDEVGQNFRLPELLAAVGCAAIENLPVMVSRKRQIHRWYEEQVSLRADLDICFQQTAITDSAVWWINALILPPRLRGKAELVGMLLTTRHPRIEIRPGFYPLNKMKPFAALATECPNALELYSRMVCLPSSPMLTQDDVAFICTNLFTVIDDVLQA